MGRISKSELENIFLSRPFKTRNADEFDLENILDLFVDPTDGLIGPFDFTNAIIKGKMGSGKTMYLRANYAYHLYTLVPCLNEGSQIILPVYIKLSDFQNIRDPEEIYNAIIIKLLKEIVGVIDHLRSAEILARLHLGAMSLNESWSINKDLNDIVEDLKRLNAAQYVQTVKKSLEERGTITHQFFNVYRNTGKEVQTQIQHNTKPSFEMITNACKKLLTPFNGKLLILLDEIGSTSKSFFKGTEEADSYFETLMNQLRTLSNVRTKLAVYPNSASDILKETRYGDVISLECDMINHPEQYDEYAITIASLVERYIGKESRQAIRPEDVFEVSTKRQEIYEHLINASSGNMRRLVHLLDLSMNEAKGGSKMNVNVRKACRMMIEVFSKMKNADPRIILGGSVLFTLISVLLSYAGMELPMELSEDSTDFEVAPCEDVEIEGTFINLQLPIPTFNTVILFSLILPENDDYTVLKIQFGELKLDAKIKVRKSKVVDVARQL